MLPALHGRHGRARFGGFPWPAATSRAMQDTRRPLQRQGSAIMLHSLVLTHLEINGFKSIRSARVDLGVVNVFIGANGSGKSNVLEALGVLSAALFGSVEPETLKIRGVRPGLPSIYKTSLAQMRIPRLIKLSVAGDGCAYRLALDVPTSQSRSRWLIHSETLEREGRTLLSRSRAGCRAFGQAGQVKLVPVGWESAARAALQHVADATAARDFIERLVDYAIFAPATTVLRGLAPDTGRDPLGLAGSGLPSAFKEVLVQRRIDRIGIVDKDDFWRMIEWANQIRAVRASDAPISPAVNVGQVALQFQDKFMARGRNTLTAYDASEGALYVIFLLTAASHPRAPRLFAVDNFDHALHPRLAAQLVRVVSKGLVEDRSRQVLLTTHNPLVLDGLDLRDDQIRLFAVERATGGERDEQGETRARGETYVRRVEVTADLLDEADRGLSLSRLWVMGRLGGVPRSL